MNDVLIDFGTLRAARNTINFPRREGPTDAEIISLGSLLESILLFDKSVLPNVSHRSSSDLIEFGGCAIELREIDPAIADDVEANATKWISDYEDIDEALHVCGFHKLEQWVSSSQFAVGATLGLSKEQLRAPYIKNATNCNRYIYFPEDEEQWVSSDIIEQRDRSSVSIKNRDAFAKTWRILEHRLKRRKTNFNIINIYWLLYRSRCYELYSEALNIDYAPHPIRSEVVFNSRLLRHHSTPVNAFKSLFRVHAESVNYVNSNLEVHCEPIPVAPVLPLVVKKAKHPSGVMEEVYKMRDSTAVKELREGLSSVKYAMLVGDTATALKYTRQMKEIESFMRSEAGFESSESNVTISILGVKFNLPDKISKSSSAVVSGIKPRSLLFLKDVFSEMQKSHSLGVYRDFFRYRKPKA